MMSDIKLPNPEDGGKLVRLADNLTFKNDFGNTPLALGHFTLDQGFIAVATLVGAFVGAAWAGLPLAAVVLIAGLNDIGYARTHGERDSDGDATPAQSNASQVSNSVEETPVIDVPVLAQKSELETEQPPQSMPTVPTDVQEVSDLGTAIVEALEAFNIRCTYLGSETGPAFNRIKLRPSQGVRAKAVIAAADDLQVQLGFCAKPLIAIQAGYISVDIPRASRQFCLLHDYIQVISSNRTELWIPIGVAINDKLVFANLCDADTCHFLVAGTSGSGKTEWLRALIASLLVRYEPGQLRIALVDPKRSGFIEFANCPWLYCPICKDIEKALALLEQLVVEMESRYRLFEVAGALDIQAYNSTAREPMPWIVCIFDEFADFILLEKDAMEGCIKRLGQMARGAGIHLILGTQRPEQSVCTPLIKANLSGRVALRTLQTNDSRIALKDDSAAALLGKGDLLYKAVGRLERLQGLYVSSSEIKAFLEASKCVPDDVQRPVSVGANSVLDSSVNEDAPLEESPRISDDLAEPLKTIWMFAKKKGNWITAKDVYNNGFSLLKGKSVKHIRQYFGLLADTGYGEIDEMDGDKPKSDSAVGFRAY
jgi:DNA segregation ATPase FtsK/SpoIIIE-like protein